MNNYSKTERFIAVFLNKFPTIKLKVKKLYQYCNYLVFKKSYSFKTELKLEEIGDDTKETFFGYYDKSPINPTSEFIIYQSTDYSTAKYPSPKKGIDIVLKNIVKGTIIKRYSTCAYNWQQGAKLMWIDDYSFIFNDYNSGSGNFISKIVDARTGEIVKIIDYPIYDVSSNYALSLNFSRLSVLRPDYGYRNKKDNLDISDIKNDGITLIDLNKNSSVLLLSLESIIACEYLQEMDEASHKVNHIMISPNGDKFIFLHRYFVKGVKHDRLLLSDFKGNLQLLSDHGMISHCYWYGNDKIISYMRRNDIGDKYYTIDLLSNAITILGEGLIDGFGDGHPHISGDKMLFDIYPDRARMKTLYSYDILANKLNKLGEFLEPFKFYGETRCDLHQRWSPDGKSILFDSVHTGKRKLYKLSLNE